MAVELALTKPDPTLTEDGLRLMMAAAKRYVDSGLLPGEVNTPQKALVIMKAGRELGIPDTYALRNIHVVKGKPVCSAELLLALVRRTYGPGAIRVGKTSNTACTVQYREQGWDGISEYSFTIEDAKQAGVTGNSTWRNYPAAMLRARCISAVVRFAFPEAIAGLYTPEEMGAEVLVTDDGGVQIMDVGATSDAAPLGPVIPIRGDVITPPAGAASPSSSTTDTDAEDGDGFDRDEAEGQYVELAEKAIELGHAQSAQLSTANPADMTDEALREIVAKLTRWIAAQPKRANG